MKFSVYFFLVLALSFYVRSGECEMEAKTLIQLLNYSKTLIQDGEIKYLYHNKLFTYPDDVGKEQRKKIAIWEKLLRENVPKSKHPEATRKDLLMRIEKEKKYGGFRDSDEMFTFMESNLVFQVMEKRKKQEMSSEYAYRIDYVCVFENYPSYGHFRYYNGGIKNYFISNGSEFLRGHFPDQFANIRLVGDLEQLDKYVEIQVFNIAYLPPKILINETGAEVKLSKTDTGESMYVITHFRSNLKVKIYTRLKNGLPEVFREEIYIKSVPPYADSERYYLCVVHMYSNFEHVAALNVSFPKVREVQMFHGDGFVRRHCILSIKEMDFNLGLPANFFNLDETELTDDKGRRKRIR